MEKHKVTLGFEGHEKELTVRLAPGSPPPWDMNTELRVVGTDVRRLDGPEKVTGQAKFTYDINLPGMLHGRILRSKHPAATIKSIDVSRAQRMPGVKAIAYAFDENSIGTKPVRFAGEEILALAADSPERAEDAVRAITVVYEPKPFVVDLEAARKHDAPAVHTKGAPQPQAATAGDVEESVSERESLTEGPDTKVSPNVSKGKPRGNREAAEKTFAASANKIDRTYRTQVQTHSALETHGLVCEPLADGGLRVWASTQGVFSVRDGLADHLGIPKEKVEVISHYIGGGFGAKFGPGREGTLCARLALKANKPVKLMLDRKEEHLAVGNRPDSVQHVKLGAGADGKLTGAVVSTYGTPGVAPGGAGCANPIIYIEPDHPNLYKEEADVHTNCGPSAAFRAPGHPQGVFAFEQAMDELAHEAGIDPLEFRRRNDDNPIRKPEYDIGAREIGWAEGRNKTPGAGPAESPIRRGIGVAATRWKSGGRQGPHADVEIHRSGQVVLMNGAQDIGTGLRTAMAMIVAEELGLKPEQILTKFGESRLGFGAASGGSTTTPSTAPAVHQAAFNAKMRLLDSMAAHWGIAPQDVELVDGMVRPKAELSEPPKPPEGADGEGARESDAAAADPPSTAPPSHMKPMSFKQACALLPGDKITAGGDRENNWDGFQDGIAGVQFAEVEVDIETGEVRVKKIVAVQDAGLSINELGCRSQISGGVIQGVSYALFENRIMDRQVGHMVNPNFIDYKIAGPLDCPEIVPIVFQVANGRNSVGAMGMAEAPTVPTAAAIANAVYNAIGVRIRELPITPDRVLAALAAAKGTATA